MRIAAVGDLHCRADTRRNIAVALRDVDQEAEALLLAGDLTLHELFAKQTAAMLERADLSDEQKQSILIAMSCPCCGAGGFSFTAKLKG